MNLLNVPNKRDKFENVDKKLSPIPTELIYAENFLNNILLLNNIWILSINLIHMIVAFDGSKNVCGLLKWKQFK